MPGVFGLASSVPGNDLTLRLEVMADRLRHHAWYEEQQHADEAGIIGFGRVTTGHVNATEVQLQ